MHLARTFCVGVCAPSVPVTQFRIEALAPDVAPTSLKHAVPSITALHPSELVSQIPAVTARGVTAESEPEIKKATRPIEKRIVKTRSGL
jgi:hypothetical protein